MLGLLPDLTPRDSHSLWYTSPRNPHPQASAQPDNQPFENNNNNNPSGSGIHPPQGRRHQQLQQQQQLHNVSIDRSPLTRLRADEQYVERRRLNVQNFGQSWLKPPGIPKTLHQMREERREMEEHQEAMRREQLAAELADAEAAAAAAEAAAAATAARTQQNDGAGIDQPMPQEEAQEGMERDLDDEIPEASEGDLGYSAADSDSDESDEEQDSGGDDDDGARRAEQERNLQNLRAAQMGMNHDAFREVIARGEADTHDDYDNDEEVEEEGTRLFEEEDLVHDDGVEERGMEHDLDDDIPDADADGSGLGGYEHTDSEAELSSSDDEEHMVDASFSTLSQQQGRHQGESQRWRNSIVSDATRQSIDLNSILSRDSSIIGSSPVAQRMPGPRRS